MTQITLVLPFALPPAQLAPDLIRAMQSPALASLLSRTSNVEALPVDDELRVLPHEAWLAKALGMSDAGRPGFAAAAMRGYGLEAGQGTWFIVNPAHIEIARSHLLMSDLRQLRLSDAHARALFDSARAIVDESGKTLLYGDAATWFMRADDWAGLDTASPDAAVGLNLTDWLPTGAKAAEFRKLQNEIQMLWFEHPVNVERESRGLASVNSLWPWAAGEDKGGALPVFIAQDAPAWMGALARGNTGVPADLFTSPSADTLLVCDALSEAAIATEWSVWLDQMQRLEQTLFAPALAAIRLGRLGKLRLILSQRGAQTSFTTTKLAQHAFWRRPTLNRLLP